MSDVLPGWAETIRRKYVGGESSLFLLHLNVFDELLHEARYYSLTDYLAHVLLAPSKQNIIVYDPSAGVTIVKDGGKLGRIDELRHKRSAAELLPILEVVLFSADSTALIVNYADTLAPNAETHFLSDQDRTSVVTFHRWSLSSELAAKDNVVFLVSEMLSDVHAKLVTNPRVAAIEIPLPDQATREAVVRTADPTIGPEHAALLARHAAGLRSVQLKSLLTPRPAEGLDDEERLAFIEQLLGTSVDAHARAQKLTALTKGMSPPEIHHLINPEVPVETADASAAYAEVLELLHVRKREIIERECAGLIEFIESSHDLSAVGGCTAIKDELRQIADNVRSGDRARVPMGLLFVGPMGCGKTFVAKAFVKESGLGAVRLKNFRSKWVGSTESNLEKVLGMIRSLGPIILVIDEGDRAFGGSEDSDGGTSSRVIARIKEFMSEPDNRGRVLFILMTNRPDKLDVDIKRAGRLDRKIPFFYPEEPQDVEAVVDALLGRHQIAHQMHWERDRPTTSARLVGYSNADLEAVTLLANEIAQQRATVVDATIFGDAVTDYLPSRDQSMLEYMELLAVFETSRRSMLPKRYQELSTEELNTLLRNKRLALRL